MSKAWVKTEKEQMEKHVWVAIEKIINIVDEQCHILIQKHYRWIV